MPSLRPDLTRAAILACASWLRSMGGQRRPNSATIDSRSGLRVYFRGLAIIHHTTLVPSKLELLAAWLPEQDWYRTRPGGPSLTRAGGFRLDDPAGEVGIEFMVVLDGGGESGRAGDGADATAYLVPLTYRAGALPGGDDALIGTAEHGVLGPRWIYDGTRDPVLLAALAEFIAGRVQAQAQRVSNTTDPTVLSAPVTVRPGERLDVRFARMLVPSAAAAAAPGQVTAQWTGPDGALIRSVFVTSELVPG
jgi:Maltokinase N-terminal cap domain